MCCMSRAAKNFSKRSETVMSVMCTDVSVSLGRLCSLHPLNRALFLAGVNYVIVRVGVERAIGCDPCI